MYVCPECGSRYPAGGFCGNDGVALAETADPLLGATIGRWRLSRVLGEGGMGRVYLALQPAIGSRVAIKVLSESCARDRDLVARFFAEARAVNVVRHEAIVSTLDLAWLDDGRPYIVMEYVAGQPLSALIKRGPLPLGNACRLVVEVLSALDAAHARGIVHRDLKPDNVLVTAAGRAKVLDFGIAKLAPGLRGDSPQTATNALLGTPEYMAPEQVAGADVDARADLYSAGVMLFECVTGQRPFAAPTLYELLRAQVEAPPPPVRSLRPDVPPAIEAVIARAMQKAPIARFASAGEMAAALAEAAASLPLEAYAALVVRAPDGAAIATPRDATTARDAPIGLAETVVAPPRRLRWWIAGGVVVAAAIAIGAIAATRGGGDGHHAAPVDAAPSTERHLHSTPGVTIIETGDSHPPEPPDYDPHHFDGDAYLARAIAKATALARDAALISIDVHGVYADGHADLALDDGFDAEYEFRSPAASHRPADKPIGVDVDIPCLVRVDAEKDGVSAWVSTDDTCDQPLRPLPRCKLGAIAKRAIAAGAPAGAVLEIEYLPDGWYVTLGDQDWSFADDC